MISGEQIEDFHRLVEQAGSVVLTTHINPDGDALGSQYALVGFLETLGKRVRVINQDPAPEGLAFIEDPAAPAEEYDSKLHDAALRETDLVILVDNSAPDRLGRMEPIMREVAAKTLCIDHHPTRDARWGHNIVDVESSATTAMIYELTRRSAWKPGPRAADAIYVGLATDTGFFRFNSMTAKGHAIAAELLELGVDPARIYRQIRERNSAAFTRLQGHALAGLRLDADGAIASVTISRELLQSVGAEDEDPAEITTPMLAIDGVRVAALYRELSDGKIKVSLRSKGQLDVHRLATEFGGGGHRNASGIVMSGKMSDAVEIVTQRCSAMLEAAGERD
jgi:phosphoesterase RecJ-like protein